VFDDVNSTDSSTTANNNNTRATVVTVNEGVVSDELRHSSTTVRAVTDCQVYAWDFHLLRAYLKRHPLEGNAMQVSISADLTRKLDQSRDASHRLVPVYDTSINNSTSLPIFKYHAVMIVYCVAVLLRQLQGYSDVSAAVQCITLDASMHRQSQL
jgi:CRP-like cAMP-binding protein